MVYVVMFWALPVYAAPNKTIGQYLIIILILHISVALACSIIYLLFWVFDIASNNIIYFKGEI
jgi:hypothetical protein